jgi:hypothetical protein
MRKLALGASGMALVLALTACGSDSNDGDTGGQTNGFPVAGEQNSGSFGNLQQLVAATGDKVESIQSVKTHAETTILGMTTTSDGQLKFDGEQTAMSMVMQVGGQQMEMRLVDGVMYVKNPMTGEPGKPWQKRDVSDQLAEVGQAGNMAEQSDPRKALERLQEMGGTITSQEQTTVDGQNVTRYTVEIDAAAMMNSMGAEEGVTPEAMASAEALGTIPATLDLNADGLPVRIEMTMDMSKAFEEEIGEMPPGFDKSMLVFSVVQTFSDWGAPVDVQAPPADQVSSQPLSDF